MSNKPQTITGSIDVSKIDKQFITEVNGKKYVNIRLKFTPDNKYGNDYMVVQDVDKNTRIRCKETGNWPDTPILGNCKVWDNDSTVPSQQQQNPSVPNNDDSLPF